MTHYIIINSYFCMFALFTPYMHDCICVGPIAHRDVTDSKSESDGIRHFSGNTKSVGYLKSDRSGFKIFVSVQLYKYFRK